MAHVIKVLSKKSQAARVAAHKVFTSAVMDALLRRAEEANDGSLLFEGWTPQMHSAWLVFCTSFPKSARASPVTMVATMFAND